MSRQTQLVRVEVAENGLEFWRTDPALTPPPVEERLEYWCEVRCPTCALLLAGGPCATVGALWDMWKEEKVRHVTKHPKGQK